ncbi:hypothetical protein P3S67_026659 [Capsicum chacoense]
MNILDDDQIPTIKKVINSSSVFCFKCANSNCKWWLRVVKYTSSDRFVIYKHEKHHRCCLEHISGQNPHATAKVLGEYFRSSFPNGKGPLTRVMANQILTDFVLVSYWKVYTAMWITKDLVRGTLEHGYEVLDAYRYIIESTNPGSKTTLHLDENRRFKYFFLSYGTWIQGFRHLRKGIAVDGMFLRSSYNGVLLAVVAQDAENHIFPMGSLFFTSSYFGCCIRHLGENIRNNYHNERVVTLFIEQLKHIVEEFLDHFNQIVDMNPKVAEFLACVNFERWSRAFCPANMYNIMISNIVESVNSLFGDERELLIKAMVDKISEKYCDFLTKGMYSSSAQKKIPICSQNQKKISTNISLGNRLFSHKIADYKFHITSYGDAAMVDLQTRSCTCRVFDLEKIPCPHAMAALQAQYGHIYGPKVYEHFSQYYSVEKYEMAYSVHITPVPPEESWVIPAELIGRLIPPPYIDPNTIKLERKPYKRTSGVGESFSSRKNKYHV